MLARSRTRRPPSGVGRIRLRRDERDVHAIYHKYFDDPRKERQLFSTGAFFLTFAACRGVTHAIRAERGPFKNVKGPGGKHIHHMTFGIIDLLTIGFLWMLEIGINEARSSSRTTAAVFGSGAALTLDEFALWLNLEDDYWSAKGRESIDAVAIFGSLLTLGALGKGFFKELLQHARTGERTPSEFDGASSNGRNGTHP